MRQAKLYRARIFFMKYTTEEIEKLKELKRLKTLDRLQKSPFEAGALVFSKYPPQNALRLEENIYVLTAPAPSQEDFLWLPSLDDLLVIASELQISFSQITDFLHRRRFADGKERLGVLQLLIETSR